MQDDEAALRQTTDVAFPDLKEIGRIDLRTGPELLAGLLREQILAGVYPQGTALSPERELVSRAKLSRPTVRAALRILETEGLVETRQGRNGGSFVRRVDEGDLTRAVNLFVRGLPVDTSDLIETRTVLECTIARFAATRRGDDDLVAMRALLDDMEPLAEGHPEDFARKDTEWRMLLARAAGNQLLAGFVLALSSVGLPPVGDGQPTALVPLQERHELLRSNRRIFQAIQQGDPAAAARRMARQFARMREAKDDPPAPDAVSPG